MRATVYIDGRKMGSFDYEHPVEDGKTIPIPTASDEYDSEATIAVHDGDGSVWMGTTKLLRDGVGTGKDTMIRHALNVAKSIVGPHPINAMTRSPTVAQMQTLQAALGKAGVL